MFISILSSRLVNDALNQTLQKAALKKMSRHWQIQALLIAGCAVTALGAAALGRPELYLQADPELAQLLRGMALIKTALVVAAVSVLLWRFGQPLPRRFALGYSAGAWLAVGACTLVWQLTFIAAAAVVFHVGELTMLIVAWRDHRA